MVATIRTLCGTLPLPGDQERHHSVDLNHAGGSFMKNTRRMPDGDLRRYKTKLADADIAPDVAVLAAEAPPEPPAASASPADDNPLQRAPDKGKTLRTNRFQNSASASASRWPTIRHTKG